jgi:predicted metal-dependent phosphoesterase TrpH
MIKVNSVPETDRPLPRRRFDLHVHSWYSYDAHLSPEELFAAAEGAGIEALAIADHHNMDGFAAFAEAAAAHPAVRWIPAMEVSVATEDAGFDIVALNVPLDAPQRLAEVVDRYRRWMRDFNRCVLAGFAEMGIPFGRGEADRMLDEWRPGPARATQGEVRLPNRGLRPWLVEHGALASGGEYSALLERALEIGGGRPPLPRAEDVMPRFKALGAALMLAHPGRALEARGEAGMDEIVAATQVDGIEVGHTSHTGEQVGRYVRYAGARGLLMSGGTDVHFHADLPEIGRHHCRDEWAAALMRRLGMQSGKAS